jgi:hypothetical protein
MDSPPAEAGAAKTEGSPHLPRRQRGVNGGLGEKSAERKVRRRRSFMSRLPFAGSGQEAATHKAASGRPNGRGGSAASKPAPFAERKNAKDAAPAKSNRGAIEVRCQPDG